MIPGRNIFRAALSTLLSVGHQAILYSESNLHLSILSETLLRRCLDIQ